MQERTILIPGQGPVMDEKPHKKIIPADTPTQRGALNWWGSELSVAGAALFLNEPGTKFQIMGGPTGPEGTDSEAELIGQRITHLVERKQVSAPIIDLEKGSTNTLENLVNICNEQLDEYGSGQMGMPSVDIVGASFHLTRTKILMKLFAIPYDRVIGAKNLMEFEATEAGDQAQLLDLQQRHDTNAALRVPWNKTEERMDAEAKRRGVDLGYYARGEDNLKTIAQKGEEEDIWTRALLTMPDYSLPYFARIENDERLMRILQNFDTLFFAGTDSQSSALNARGIDLTKDTPDEIREKLAQITRKVPDEMTRQAWIAQHRREGWPDDIEQKLNNVLDLNYGALVYDPDTKEWKLAESETT